MTDSPPRLRVAVAQIDTTVGDFEGNAAKILELGRRAESEGAHLVLFPELAVCGYPPRDLVERPAFVTACERTTERLARASGSALWIFGSLWGNRGARGRRVFNTAVAARDGRRVAIYRKRLLPTYDVFDEGRYVEPGDRGLTLRLRGRRVAVTICEDIWNDKTFWKHPLYPTDPVAELVRGDARPPRQHLRLALHARQEPAAAADDVPHRAALGRAAGALQSGRRQRRPRLRRRVDGLRRPGTPDRPRGNASRKTSGRSTSRTAAGPPRRRTRRSRAFAGRSCWRFGTTPKSADSARRCWASPAASTPR